MAGKGRGKRTRRAAGCVVYRFAEGQPQFLLIRDPYKRWTLPKGHLEEGEDDRTAATREVHEETGLSGELGPQISAISYSFFSNGRLVEKQVAFFLMRAVTETAVPQQSEGITAVGWFPPEEARRLIGYDQVREVLDQAITVLDGI